jgi:hypothetical protein
VHPWDILLAQSSEAHPRDCGVRVGFSGPQVPDGSGNATQNHASGRKPIAFAIVVSFS